MKKESKKKSQERRRSPNTDGQDLKASRRSGKSTAKVKTKKVKARKNARRKAAGAKIKRSPRPVVEGAPGQDLASSGAGTDGNDHVLAPILEGYDENSLAAARTQWFFGEWQTLADLDLEAFHHHPDRDRFALMVASAHQQLGSHDQARKYSRVALDWGCSPRLVAQVLVAGVHNTLGRAAALKQDDAGISRHFSAAVSVADGGDTSLVGHARSTREMVRMGLLPQAAELVDRQLSAVGNRDARPVQQQADYQLLKEEIELVRHAALVVTPGAGQSSVDGKTDNKEIAIAKKSLAATYSQDAYEFYQSVSKQSVRKDAAPFIMLDSKSLPRSGVHYMKNKFSRLLQERFSFCEWYQEPGCCRKMPCALKSFAERSMAARLARLRVIKSHDFELDDPVYAPMFSARRVVLIRDPLYLLTSYFTLSQLPRFKSALEAEGINLEKIWLNHEPDVLAGAYHAMDKVFVPPAAHVLEGWLSNQVQYIMGFLDKWVHTAVSDPQSFLQVVHYEEIDVFINSVLAEIWGIGAEETAARVESIKENSVSHFHARDNAFQVKSEKVSDFLNNNSAAFIEAAHKIIVSDSSGLMGRYANTHLDTS